MSLGPSTAGPVWPAPSDIVGAHPGPANRGRTAAVLVAIAVAVAVLGIPLGLLWSALAPDVPLVVTEQDPVFADAEPEQPAAGDGWFALLAAPFGATVAAGAWLLTPRNRGPAAVVAVSAGAAAAGLLAWWLGRQVGLAGFESAVQTATAGTTLARPADLRVVATEWWPPLAGGVPLVPGLFAAVTYTLLAAWSRYPDLRPQPPGPPGLAGPPGPAGAPGS